MLSVPEKESAAGGVVMSILSTGSGIRNNVGESVVMTTRFARTVVDAKRL